MTTLSLMFSVTAFSQDLGKASPASKKDVRILCKSIEELQENEASDEAVDLEKCLKTKMLSRTVSEGIVEVKGRILFNSSDRSFKRNCEVSYYILTSQIIAEPLCQ